VEFEKCNRGFQVLIAKFVVERTGNTGRSDVMDDKEYPNTSDDQHRANNRDDNL